MSELDHTGRPAPADESPDTIIDVWEVIPSSVPADCYWIRGWQDMLDFVRNEMERMLEQSDGTDDDPHDASVRVRLMSVTKGEYDEVYEEELP